MENLASQQQKKVEDIGSWQQAKKRKSSSCPPASAASPGEGGSGDAGGAEATATSATGPAVGATPSTPTAPTQTAASGKSPWASVSPLVDGKQTELRTIMDEALARKRADAVGKQSTV